MVCSYLLSLPILPPPPQSSRNRGSKEDRKLLEAQRRQPSEQTSSSKSSGDEKRPGEQETSASSSSMPGHLLLHPDQALPKPSSPSRKGMMPDLSELSKGRRSSLGHATRRVSGTSTTQKLKLEDVSERLHAVFEFHTSRRLKPAKTGSSNPSSPLRSRKSSMNVRQCDDAETAARERQGSDSSAWSSPSRNRSLSNLVGSISRKASRHRLDMPASDPMSNSVPSLGRPGLVRAGSQRLASKSGTNLRALGASPAGRSCNDLGSCEPVPPLPLDLSRMSMSDPWASTVSVDDTQRGEGAETRKRPSVQIDPLSLVKGPSGLHGGSMLHMTECQEALVPPRELSQRWISSPHPIDSGEEGFGVDEEEMIGADGEEVVIPRLAVSIPSQRRWVGYWARMLADMDPRAALDHNLMHPKRRTVKINRIFVDRRANKSSSDSKAKEGPLSLQIARYEEKLVERLEDWERTSRRRRRAFGALDPRLPAPNLLPSEFEDEEEEEKGENADEDEDEAKEKGEKGTVDATLAAKKRELRHMDHERRWKDCEKRNRDHHQEYDRKLRQHGNDTGVGQWGINVLAEKDVVRNFYWGDDEHGPRQEQMVTLAMVSELERVTLSKQAAAPMLSTADLGAGLGAGPARSGSGVPTMMRYTFEPARAAEKAQEGERASSPATGGFTRLAQSVGMQKKAVGMPSPARSSSGDHLRPAACSNSSSDTSHTRSSIWTPLQATTPAVTAPPSPTTSEEYVETDGQGLVVDADRELQIKVLVGKSGTSHAKLPDVLSAGYVWLIPAFETPLLAGEKKPRKGQVVQCQFGMGEIDFRKGRNAAPLLGGDIRNITVEFEWVEVGWHEADEDTDEEDSESGRE